MSALAQIGHNNPPTPIELARPVMSDLSAWMAEHPVIETEDDARQAKVMVDRAKGCAGDIEAERVRLVAPLNEQLEQINTAHKSVHNTDSKRPGLLDKIVGELKKRLTAFATAEEEKRLAIAEAARRAAEEAERIAREAEQRERDALSNASQGELGVNVEAAVVEADSAFVEAKRADRIASRAERDSTVRIGGGWGRTMTLRTKEMLVLDDAVLAINALGVTDNIRDAILTAARDYRRKHDMLPAGVSAVTERII